MATPKKPHSDTVASDPPEKISSPRRGLVAVVQAAGLRPPFGDFTMTEVQEVKLLKGGERRTKLPAELRVGQSGLVSRPS